VKLFCEAKHSMTGKYVAKSRQRLVERGGRRLNLWLSPEATNALQALSQGRSHTQTIEWCLQAVLALQDSPVPAKLALSRLEIP